ncbi:hypothetical protein MK489_07420 [Myxococcota bacterium]|nr:hypothetical protein [Myxococcota bacterium]
MGIVKALARLGEDDAVVRRSKLRAFEVILLLHLFTTTVWWASGGWWVPTGDFSWIDGPMLLTLTCVAVLTVMGIVPRTRTIALPALTALQVTVVWNNFPETANHTFLELSFLMLLTLWQPRDETEEALLLGSLRWMVVVVFVYAGIQKAVHGYYSDGVFLTYQLQHPGFHSLLSWLLPADEVVRISSYANVAGDGPYRITSLPLQALSNLSYVWEVAAGLLLLFHRTRVFALAATIAFLVITEIMAREFFFGALYLNALLLFTRSDLNRRLIWLFVAFDVWVMLVKLELLPAVTTF